MKRGMKLLFFGLFSVLLFSFVNAQIAVHSPEDIIFRISSQTNAHGEVYNGAGSYGTPIYYSDIFTSTYSGSVPVANLRICTGSNRVLRLSANTNAHAQEPGFTGTAYPVDICYGDLVCQSVAGNNNCPASYNEVVSLSSNDNAHIETASANQYNLAGNTKICCQMTSTPQIIDARWLYYDGSIISSPNLNVCSDHVVIARVRTANIADGQIIGFLFSDDDSLVPDPIVYLESIVVNNEARIELNLSDPGVQAVLQNELGGSEGQDLELYFEAGNPSISPTVVTSQQIFYQSDSSLCSFEPPEASIEAPKHRGIYFVNTQVNFTSGCSSQIGPVQTEWTITPQNGQAFTRTEATFMHQFTSAGQVNVELKCTDSEGRFDINESQILVVASPYTFAYINQPSFESITYTSPPGTGPYFPNEVSFSASDSFAVNTISSTAPCSLECIGGNCPVQTENSPTACGLSGGPITITQTTNSYSPLLFNWTFLDNDWTTDWASFETSNGIYSGAVQYDDMSDTLDDKKIRVNVRHVATGANANFERDFTLGRCLNNGNTYYASRTESYSTNQENSACKGGDGVALTADDCCAVGLQCLPDENDPTNPSRYSCQIPAGGLILECNDFATQSACNGNTNPAIPLASYGQTPNACTTLSCVWSATSNSCGLNVTTYQTSSSGQCSSGPGAVVVDSCSYTTTVSECVAGRKTITYNTIAGGATCNRSPVTVPCGSLSFELSFFGLRQFLISILLIGAIYLVLNFRKEINDAKK